MRPTLLGLVVLVGCASAAPTPLVDLTPWRPPPGQSCQAGGGDFALPTVLDSARAVAAIAALAPADGALLLSVATDSAGAVTRFRRIDATVPEPDAAALERALQPLVRGPDRRGRLLVETADGEAARIAVGPSQHCRPAYLNQDEVSRALTRAYLDHGRTGSAEVWMFVDTAGAVEKSQINSGSGDLLLDLAILSASKLTRFRPALLDRQPVPVWVAVTFTVQAGCDRAVPDSLLWQLPMDDPCRRRP